MIAIAVQQIGGFSWLQREDMPKPVRILSLDFDHVSDPAVAAEFIPSFAIVGDGAYMASFRLDVVSTFQNFFSKELIFLGKDDEFTASNQKGVTFDERRVQDMLLCQFLYPGLKSLQEDLHPEYATDILAYWSQPEWCYLNLTIHKEHRSKIMTPNRVKRLVKSKLWTSGLRPN